VSIRSKNPTAQGVSALLRRTGFSHYGTGSGFAVHKSHDTEGAVTVVHHFRLMSADTAAARQERLAAYAKVITDAGWAVESDGHRLTVTAAGQGESAEG
jgi:hypothetical protein